MKVRIIQYLCPSRHCIIALPYESDSGEADDSKIAVLQAQIREMRIDPWCGICRSTNLTYDDQPTRFETLAKAWPSLIASAEAQATTRQFLKASKG